MNGFAIIFLGLISFGLLFVKVGAPSFVYCTLLRNTQEPYLLTLAVASYILFFHQGDILIIYQGL